MRERIKWIVMAAGLALLGACGDDNGNGPTPDTRGIDASTQDSKADTGKAPDKGGVDQSKGDMSAAKILDNTHGGWKNPLCFSCHDGKIKPYPHSSESYKEPDCADCHGYNGAPHKSHATKSYGNCTNCHSTVSHASKFTSPDDCITCHYHP